MDPGGGNVIYLTHISGTSVDDPVVVNDPPRKLSSTPAVAADGDRVYVAWAEDEPVGEILLRVGTDHGQSLGPAMNVSRNPGGSIYPKLRAGAGKVYLAWLDGSMGRTDILFTRSTDGGATFPVPANLSRQFNAQFGSWAWFFSMGVSGDQVYIAWPIQKEILLVGSKDGGQNLIDYGDSLLPVVLAMAPGADTVFRPIVRPGQSGVYATWDVGDAEDGNGEIWELPGAFGGFNREVMFRAQPGLEPDLILDRVGAVQVVYDPPKLVAGKKTLVQAVITSGFDHEVQTTVKLTYDPGTGTETTLTQPVTLRPGTNTVNLPNDDFLLPSGTTFRARVVVDPDNSVVETVEDNNTKETSVMVAQTRAFRVLFVPVQVGDDGAVTCTTLARIQEESSSFLRAILPVAESDFYSSYSCLTNWWVPAPQGDRLSDEELNNLVKGLDELATYAGVDKVIGVTRPGWFRDVAPPATAGAAGLSLTANGIPWDGVLVDASARYQQVTAHEVLHTYGWVDASDPLYLPPPGPPGHMGYFLSPGYWVAARTPLTMSVDLMFPNEVVNPWISSNTYAQLFRTFRLNPSDPPVINIAGTIFKDGHATLDPWYRLESTLDRELGQSGAYTLVYLDQNGVQLGATGFDVQFDNPYYDSAATTADSAPFSLRVPEVAGTARLELRQGNTVLAARDVSPNPPQVHVTSPNGGEIAAPGQPLTITWTSSDANGGALTHTVSLSRDGGQTWLPVAFDRAETQVTFTPTAADTTTQALVRVTVTDGINTAEDVSDAPFTIRTGVGSEVTLGPTVNVSDTAIPDPAGQSSFKAVSVADGPNLYLSWSDHGSFDFRRSTDGGASFGPLTELGKTRDTNPAYGTRMAASNGNVYVAWRGYVPPESYTQAHILFRRSIDGGASFEQVQSLEAAGGYSSEDPQVAASGSNVYVLWYDWQTSNLVLRVSHDAGATFGDPLVVGNAAPMPSVSGANAVSPRLVADDSNVFVVWSSYANGMNDVFFRRSTDAGVTFADSAKLSSNPSGTQADIDPQLALADGHVYAAWREVVPTGDTSSVNHLFIRTSADDGASFSPALDLRPQWPASAPLDYGTLKFFSLVTSRSDVYLAWMTGPLSVYGGGPDNGQELILLSASRDHGASFAAPVRVEAADESHLTDPPEIAASANNVYVVWSQQFPVGSTGSFTAEERLRRSTDGGASFDDPRTLTTSGSCDTYPGFQTLPLIPAADGARVLWQGRSCTRTSFMDKDIFLRAVHESVSANQPPEVNAGADQTVAAGDIVTLAGVATDPDGDRLLVSWSQTGGPPVALGTTDALALDFRAPEVNASTTLTFQLTANDGLATSASTVSVTINPRAPITDFHQANPELWDLMVGSSFPPVLTLSTPPVDGTGPVVMGTPDRTPDANGWYNHPVTITWSGQGGSGSVTCDPPTVYSGPAGSALVIEGKCTDGAGNVGTGSVTINYDGAPPTGTCSVTPNVLWPANHKLVTVTASVAVEDQAGLSGPDGFTLVSVTSSEPDNGLGDGDTPNDIQGWAVGTVDTSGQLRAERSGTGPGRVYTLTYQVKD
ncbi:MAG TPA: hypothetical protein VNE21_03990, partial [Mycobacteriales bacterium]|nr:hypothetical protein [Mycobacteriales bacterium]